MVSLRGERSKPNETTKKDRRRRLGEWKAPHHVKKYQSGHAIKVPAYDCKCLKIAVKQKERKPEQGHGDGGDTQRCAHISFGRQ